MTTPWFDLDFATEEVRVLGTQANHPLQALQITAHKAAASIQQQAQERITAVTLAHGYTAADKVLATKATPLSQIRGKPSYKLHQYHDYDLGGGTTVSLPLQLGVDMPRDSYKVVTAGGDELVAQLHPRRQAPQSLRAL